MATPRDSPLLMLGTSLAPILPDDLSLASPPLIWYTI